MKSWPFPSLLDVYFLKEPQKLRLDLSAVSYAASMTACERVSYWEQVRGAQGFPGVKLKNCQFESMEKMEPDSNVRSIE